MQQIKDFYTVSYLSARCKNIKTGEISIEKMNFEKYENNLNKILPNQIMTRLQIDSKTSFCYAICIGSFQTLYIGKDFDDMKFSGQYSSKIEQYFSS